MLLPLAQASILHKGRKNLVGSVNAKIIREIIMITHFSTER